MTIINRNSNIETATKENCCELLVDTKCYVLMDLEEMKLFIN